ncbi:hypothetical protein GCM10014719_47890 [Planomonospora parontospora subsp. antibiotica]|nr:hypothetical protein GCM10014719_47890 [Planomonospora parontospora subsp. antibiotica]GII17918.1 hypothetical protein Ppa05_46440 [Planomonospora parontospora subsp. antibiotica]
MTVINSYEDIMHQHRSTPWRHGVMDEVFPPEVRAQVLAAVSQGTPLKQAMEKHGLSDEVAYGRARWDGDWERHLHSALLDGRNPDLRHGRAWTYAKYRCRCPECQATQPGCTAAQRFLQQYRPAPARPACG